MKILHVSLGNPKQHTGGLNRYCGELMEEQRRLNNEVLLLYPGKTTLCHRQKIKRISNYEYAIQNPLPVAITYGIDDPKRYMLNGDKACFELWLSEVKPDIVHVHSIQGVHLEFFESVRDLNIPMVFTTHDYYPMCYYCTLVRRDGLLCQGREAEQCAMCNSGAGLSKNRQLLLQSTVYQKIKSSKAIKYLKKKFVAKTASSTETKCSACTEEDSSKIIDFVALGKYYDAILNCFTVVHANSPRTGEVYRTFRPQLNCQVIPITRSGLIRSEHIRKTNKSIRFGYMGGMLAHKGYFLFQKALKILDDRGQTDWEAWYYGGEYVSTEDDKQDMRKHFCGLFSSAQADNVWDNIDVLLVPCVWGETYGFVILEALCHGIPVICSELAGSKFLVKQVNSYLVFKHDNIQELVEKMIWINNPDNYTKLVQQIAFMQLPIDWRNHVNQIMELYRQVEKERLE